MLVLKVGDGWSCASSPRETTRRRNDSEWVTGHGSGLLKTEPDIDVGGSHGPAVVGKPYSAEPTTVFTLVMFT